MNGYTLRKKGIRSKGSIIREMVMYGFSNEDIVEFTNYKIMTVKSIVHKMNIEVLFKKYKFEQPTETEKYLIDSGMFSINEMHYGYTGESKYSYNTLSRQEQKIYNKF
jgi:hypothetical protein